MSVANVRTTTALKSLIHRQGRVLGVFHPPSAAHARIMEKAGCEAGFVGTGGVVGAYTGLADIGTASLTECVTVGGWIAQSVKFPLILDGDTGHGGIMAVRRLVREAIKAGLAGLRLDDQPLEGKGRAHGDGHVVASREECLARYRAAVDMRDELDPDFVIMAQCYGRTALNGGLDVVIDRMKAYKEEAGVDWVQFEAPQAIAEIERGRAAVDGPYSFQRGGLDRYLTFAEHLLLGVNIAWLPAFTHHVTWAALWDFMQAFQKADVQAWNDFVATREGRPYPEPDFGGGGEGPALQRLLEERYLGRRD